MKHWHIMKFGGSSLGTHERLAQVCGIVTERAARGPVAVVVSAPGDTTDRLLACFEHAARGAHPQAHAELHAWRAWLRQLVEQAGLTDAISLAGIVEELADIVRSVAPQRVELGPLRDYFISAGERVSIRVVAAALQAAGLDALPVDARDFVHTDDRHGSARVECSPSLEDMRAQATEWVGRVPIISGFLGRAPNGATTTLGRDGSDYSAALVAQGLSASSVDIWTDVSGVLTADPAVVPDARPIRQLSYGEALELSVFGARVLHPRTLVPLMEDDIVLGIRNTLTPTDAGTIVDRLGRNDDRLATSVTSLRDLALIDIRSHVHGLGTQLQERAARVLHEQQVDVWLSTHAAHGAALSVVVRQADVSRLIPALTRALGEDAAAGAVAPIAVRAPVSLVTVVAEAMGREPNVAGRFFGALGRAGINVLSSGQSATARSISAAVEGTATNAAVRAIHDAFHIDRPRAHVVLMGVGGVGGALLRQFDARGRADDPHDDLEVRLVGAFGSDRGVLDAGGIDPATVTARLQREDAHRPTDTAIIERLRALGNPILIDCTASDTLTPLHLAALRAGVHVVTANKKPLAARQSSWDLLQAEARARHRTYAFETTVGAGLPVLSTLADLVRTGDRVHQVEGALSGTLGFVVDALHQGISLADAVRQAQQRGFTEPFPGEDLSGTDAARKAIILARALGLSVEPDRVRLTPLVPENLLHPQPLDRFYAGLLAYGPSLEARVQRLLDANRRLRYLAVLEARPDDPEGPVLTVGPTEVAFDHPAAGLRGAEALISFRTDRYHDTPLVIRGPGAGNDVTAAGVFADVLRIASHLKGG